MKLLVALGLIALAHTGFAQVAPNPCCSLTAAATAESPSTIKISLLNSGNKPLLVALRPVSDSYLITVRARDGSEPPRTAWGAELQNNDGVPGPGSVQVKSLEKGETVSQTFDLSRIWTFAEGSYVIGLSRVVHVDDQPLVLRTELTISIPTGYAADKGCTIEAKAKAASRRAELSLRAPAASEVSLELERTLTKKIDFVWHPRDHDVVLAFMDMLMGSHLSGGMTLSNIDAAHSGLV